MLPLFTAERAMFRTTSLSTASSTDRSGSEKVGECRDDEDERETGQNAPTPPWYTVIFQAIRDINIVVKYVEDRGCS